jgi:hypothetical protein
MDLLFEVIFLASGNRPLLSWQAQLGLRRSFLPSSGRRSIKARLEDKPTVLGFD